MSQENKSNARNEYVDIINHPRWEPDNKHPRMSLHDRAAQFAPFAALSGYDDMIDEEIRLTDQQIELADSQINQLNQKLNHIKNILANGTHPKLTITYFIPDARKAGGRYETITAQVRRIDPTTEKIFFIPSNQPNIPESITFDKLLSLECNLLDNLEDNY